MSTSVLGRFSVKIIEEALKSIVRVFKRKLISVDDDEIILFFYFNFFKQVLTDIKQITLSGACKLN